nr:universal stress protein [uncultured Flavobacterium sp.]
MNLPFTIVAATNFSANSVNAVTYAARLAKLSGATLLIFHSFSMPLHSANSHITAEGFKTQLDKVTARLALMASEIAQTYSIPVNYNCSYSFVEDHLDRIIHENDVKLVVMGMAERSLEQDLTGNTTTFVIKNLAVPVLAIPEGVRFQNVSRVLFAFDVKKKIAAGKLLWLSKAVKFLKAEIEFFSVDERIDKLKSKDPSVMAKNMLDEEFQDVKYLYKSVRSNTVIAEIEKEINHFGADVLVMMPQKYGFWDTIVHRSKTRIMASGLNIPLLSLPNY